MVKTVKIIMDIREKEPIKLSINNILDKGQFPHISYEEKQLAIGDIHIVIKGESNDVVHLIFERKKISDLASSISDGRYREQSFRLDKCDLHNHNIIYLIEGDLKNFKPYTKKKNKPKVDKDTLYSSIFSLLYYKGFSVYRSDNCNESADILIKFANKLHKEIKSGKRQSYYKDTPGMTTPGVTTPGVTTHGVTTPGVTTPGVNTPTPDIGYIDTMKIQKKDFINTDNIGKIMLMQIPGVSANFANVIMSEHKTIIDLICALQEDNTCIDNMTYNTSTGKSRRINKTCIENIKKYLLQ